MTNPIVSAIRKEAVLLFGVAAVAVTSAVEQATGGLTLKEFGATVATAVIAAIARQFVSSQATVDKLIVPPAAVTLPPQVSGTPGA